MSTKKEKKGSKACTLPLLEACFRAGPRSLLEVENVEGAFELDGLVFLMDDTIWFLPPELVGSNSRSPLSLVAKQQKEQFSFEPIRWHRDYEPG